ncbi:MAG: hypothetical protein HUJ93_07920 [Bacteroidales bacterium]|nr:hypothetical protein [Bacteroidales bacterium]
MKKVLLFAAAAMIAACTPKVNLEQVPAPDWYVHEGTFAERNSMMETLPLNAQSKVFFGDNIASQGDWRLFFNDTTIVNRAIPMEWSGEALYRIDQIAKYKPASIFVSVGYWDLCAKDADGKYRSDAKTAIANCKEIMERAAAISPATRLYYLSVVPNARLDAERTADVQKVNEAMKEGAGKYVYVDITSNLVDANGVLKTEFTPDGNMLNGKAYEDIANTLAEHIGSKSLLKVDSVYSTNHGAYYDLRVTNFASVPHQERPVVLLGDSLTDDTEWEEFIPLVNILNMGISGDTVEGMKERVDIIAPQQPIMVFIMAGINDFTSSSSLSAVKLYEKYSELIQKIKEKCPLSQIIVQSTLPMNPIHPHYEGVNERVAELNKLLAAAAPLQRYVFLDVASAVTDEEGNLKADFTTDGCHLNAEGYYTWATKIVSSGLFIGVNAFQSENK